MLFNPRSFIYLYLQSYTFGNLINERDSKWADTVRSLLCALTFLLSCADVVCLLCPSLVPPNIVDRASSKSNIVVREKENVTLRCRGDGFPEPQIKWRREDSRPIETSDGRKGKSGSRVLGLVVTFYGQVRNFWVTVQVFCWTVNVERNSLAKKFLC